MRRRARTFRRATQFRALENPCSSACLTCVVFARTRTEKQHGNRAIRVASHCGPISHNRLSPRSSTAETPESMLDIEHHAHTHSLTRTRTHSHTLTRASAHLKEAHDDGINIFTQLVFNPPKIQIARCGTRVPSRVLFPLFHSEFVVKVGIVVCCLTHSGSTSKILQVLWADQVFTRKVDISKKDHTSPMPGRFHHFQRVHYDEEKAHETWDHPRGGLIKFNTFINSLHHFFLSKVQTQFVAAGFLTPAFVWQIPKKRHESKIPQEIWCVQTGLGRRHGA